MADQTFTECEALTCQAGADTREDAAALEAPRVRQQLPQVWARVSEVFGAGRRIQRELEREQVVVTAGDKPQEEVGIRGLALRIPASVGCPIEPHRRPESNRWAGPLEVLIAATTIGKVERAIEASRMTLALT